MGNPKSGRDDGQNGQDMQPETRIIAGDCLQGMATLPDSSVHCAITSPPYWGLRDYGNAGQIGLEPTPEAYVARMVEVFREVRRVLREDGTCWINLGDSYSGNASSGGKNSNDGGPAVRVVGVPTKRGDGLKPKDLVGIPWRVAFALQADGWWLRQDIIWHKPNPMPESVRDRCTKAHEYVFLLAKSVDYFFDAKAIDEPLATKPHAPGNKAGKDGGHLRNDFGTDAMARVWGASGRRNRRSVWKIATRPYRGAHFAVMPPALVADCLRAGTSAAGCCAECGAPIRRVVSRERVATRPGTDTKTTGNAAREGNRDPLRHVTQTETVGWEPSCACNAARIPATVFDPFAGSGTTLAVAVANGRSGIGCELNPDYIALAEQRISEARSVSPLERQALPPARTA